MLHATDYNCWVFNLFHLIVRHTESDIGNNVALPVKLLE